MKARLLETRELAPEIRHFRFAVEDAGSFLFTPGQFVSITAELAGKSITRAYSLAAPPSGSHLELCLNRVREGRFSPYLFDLEPGARVEFKGPYGAFVLKPEPAESILVATGTGIVPFRAILLAKPEFPLPITLIYGARHESNLLYRAEFEALASRHLNFRFLPTVTQPGATWVGRTGRVQPQLLEKLGARRDVDIYLCGLRAMVDDVRALLKECGYDRKRIVYERFD